MEQELKQMLAGLEDAGCAQEEIREAERLCALNDRGALVRCLRKCRCSLMDALHESQRRVDRLDYLIRQAEKAENKPI